MARKKRTRERKRLGKEEELAYERTMLSEERTMLSFFRTALTSFLFGIAIMNIFHNWTSYFFGGAFILVGIIFSVIGFVRYKKEKIKLEQEESK